MKRITILGNSLMLILLLFTPFYTFNLDSSHSSQQNHQKKDNNVAKINNIQVPIVSKDVAVKDSYAYIPDYHQFRYYDLENLEYKGKFRDYYNEIDGFHTIFQIEIQDNYMYLLRDYGYNSHYTIFCAAEIFSPSAIVILGNHTFNATDAGTMVTDIHVLKIEDNYAFIGTNWYETTDNNQIIYLTTIIDISNKSNPKEISSYRESGIGSDLYVKNDKLFLTVMDQNKLVVLDISNKSQPIKINQLDLSFRPTSISIQNNYLYLSYNDAGFEIYDINDIFNPVLIVTSETLSRKIILEDNLAYVLEIEKLTIFDTSDVNKLEKIGEKRVRFRGENGRFLDCIVENNLVLAVRGVQYYGSFIIFDCTNAKRPKIIFPDVEETAFRYYLVLIIIGYISSPLILFSIISLTTLKLIQKKRKKKK